LSTRTRSRTRFTNVISFLLPICTRPKISIHKFTITLTPQQSLLRYWAFIHDSILTESHWSFCTIVLQFGGSEARVSDSEARPQFPGT
jgi:hypothetical protein